MLISDHEHSAQQRNVEADNTVGKENKQNNVYSYIYKHLFFFSSHPDFTQQCHTYFLFSCGVKQLYKGDSVCSVSIALRICIHIHYIYIYILCVSTSQTKMEGTKILQERRTTFAQRARWLSRKNTTVGCCNSLISTPHTECYLEQAPKKNNYMKKNKVANTTTALWTFSLLFCRALHVRKTNMWRQCFPPFTTRQPACQHLAIVILLTAS